MHIPSSLECSELKWTEKYQCVSVPASCKQHEGQMNGNIKAHVLVLINTPCSENALFAPRSVCLENLWANKWSFSIMWGNICCASMSETLSLAFQIKFCCRHEGLKRLPAMLVWLSLTQRLTSPLNGLCWFPAQQGAPGLWMEIK